MRQTGLVGAPGDVVRRMLNGLSIGGVPWRVEQHCLYHDGGRSLLLGRVVDMFYGKDDMMDGFIIFKIANKQITQKMGHYCLFSNDTLDTVYVLWRMIAWKCKVFSRGEGQDKMALPYASCDSRELMEFS